MISKVTVLAVLLLLAAPELIAQTHANDNRVTTTFNSPDGVFRFKYQDSVVLCRRDLHQSDLWVPSESCLAYIPVCADIPHRQTLACVAYSARDLKKETNFNAAAFSVNALTQALGEDDCLSMTEPYASVPTHIEYINGAKVKALETDGVALGHIVREYVYRTFHESRCYELEIRITYSNIGNFSPGTVKEFDLDAVHGSLKQVLDSFEFLK